jgi:hypothetical protein
MYSWGDLCFFDSDVVLFGVHGAPMVEEIETEDRKCPDFPPASTNLCFLVTLLQRLDMLRSGLDSVLSHGDKSKCNEGFDLICGVCDSA